MNLSRITLVLTFALCALFLAPDDAAADFAERACGDCNTMTCGSGESLSCENGTCRCFVGDDFKRNAYRNCFTDADCETGLKTAAYCKNRVCHVGPPSSKAFCAPADSCSARFPGTTAFNGSRCPGDWCSNQNNPNVRCYSHAFVQHIRDCRGIGSEPHFRGGVISYCSRCSPICNGSTGTACYSGYNSCGMRYVGVLYCDWVKVREEEEGWQTYHYYEPSISCTVGQDPPPESLCDAAPVGSLDGLTCAGGATGTVLDADSPASPVPVHIYDADPRPGGFAMAPIATVYTDPATRQFRWDIPPSYFDNGSHTIYAFAQDIDPSGNPMAGPRFALADSPRTVTNCYTAPSGSASIICDQPSPVIATGSVTDVQGAPVTVQVWDTTTGPGILKASGPASPSYSVSAPAFSDGLVHTVSVFALDVPTGNRQLLGTQTCIPPPTGAITSVVDPDYCESGPAMTVNWRYTSAGRQMGAFRVNVLDGGSSVFDTGKTARDGVAIPPFTTTGSVVTDGDIDYDTEYTVQLTVWDKNENQSAPVTLVHRTLDGPWVIASFSFDPSQPAAGVPIAFTAQNVGSDPGRYPTDARWDFDGNGSWDVSGVTAEHTYAVASESITIRMEARNDSMDADTYCPADSVTFGVLKAIPGYREVRPGDRSSPTPTR